MPANGITSLFLSQTPLVARLLFRSSPPTESLEQASSCSISFWILRIQRDMQNQNVVV